MYIRLKSSSIELKLLKIGLKSDLPARFSYTRSQLPLLSIYARLLNMTWCFWLSKIQASLSQSEPSFWKPWINAGFSHQLSQIYFKLIHLAVHPVVNEVDFCRI